MIATLFERQARQHPNRTALRVDGASISYAELDCKADGVASALAERLRGARRQRIGVLGSGPLGLVASMLGILKSANVWVPLDTAHPQDRLTRTAEHAGVAALLTDGETVATARAVAPRGCAIIDVEQIDGRPDPRVREAVRENELACILYTSGSMGAPKGVIHNHRNLIHPTKHWTSRFAIDERDRSLLLASFSHVAAVNDILRTLLNGACLVPFRVSQAGLDRLADLMAAEEITIYHSVPSLFRRLARLLEPRAVPSLRLVHLGGEPVFRTDVELFRRHCPADAVLVNNLSSTEVQTYAQLVIDGSTSLDEGVVPVGHEVGGKSVLLLDDAGHEVARGDTGEIVVRSESIALGYWNDPEQSARTFAGSGRQRTFRTGDLGRLGNCGRIEYLGRKDDRLKIRGHRVELSEVQAGMQRAVALSRDVEEATVAARELEAGSVTLVAYVVSRNGTEVDLGALRKSLSDLLPEPMRPEAFVVLESLPRTVTGKIDRRRLPDPERAPVESSRPRTPVERQMEGLWRQILRLDSVPRDVSFFDLGGHSLLALELASEVERLFGRSITLPELQHASTIEALVGLVERDSSLRPWPCLVPFKTDGFKTPLFLVHGLGGVVIEMRELALELDPDRPVYALQARGVDGVSERHRSIEAMATCYMSEILTERPAGPVLVGGYSMGGVVAFELARRLAQAGREPAGLLLIDAPAPLRLSLRDRLGLLRALLRVAATGRRRNGRAGPRYMRQLDRVRFQNFRAVRRYRPRPYEGCIRHVVSRTPDERPRTRAAGEIERLLLRKRGLWDDLASRVEVREVRGHHLELLRRPALDDLLVQVRELISDL